MKKLMFHLSWILALFITGFAVWGTALDESPLVPWGALVIIAAILFAALQWFGMIVDDF